MPLLLLSPFKCNQSSPAEHHARRAQDTRLLFPKKQGLFGSKSFITDVRGARVTGHQTDSFTPGELVAGGDMNKYGMRGEKLLAL